MTVEWKAGEEIKPKAPLIIKVRNGTVNGREVLEGTIARYKAQPFDIVKIGPNPLELTVIIDGKAHPDLVFPPGTQLIKYEYVERRGVAEIPRDTGGNRCTNSAYLVAEHTGGATDSPKECMLCVTASNGGFLLKSTAEVVGGLIPSNNPGAAAHEVVKKEDNRFEVCGKFSVGGPGIKGGRWEVQEDSYFKVWEAIPAQTR